MSVTYQEFRGVENLVIAEVTCDDNESGNDHGYKTGTVYDLAGAGKVTKSTEVNNDTKYYDNKPVIVINSKGKDEIGLEVSVISLEILAKITGQTYDATTGSIIEGPADPKYFALGYKTYATDGSARYVWRLKGMFSIPNEEANTKTDGTDSNGQELTYTGITTTHKFTKNGNKGANALVTDDGLGLANVSTFFSTVTDPDTIAAKTP